MSQTYPIQSVANEEPKPRPVPDRFTAYFVACTVVGLFLSLPLPLYHGPDLFAHMYRVHGIAGLGLGAIAFVAMWLVIAALAVPFGMLFAAPGALVSLAIARDFRFQGAPYYIIAGVISAGLAGLLCVLILPPAFAFILAAIFTFGQSTVYALPGALGGYLYWRLAVRPLRYPAVQSTKTKNFKSRFLFARLRAYFYACAVVGLILPLPLAWQKGGPECFVPTFYKFGAFGGTMQFVLCAITFVFFWFGIAILTVPTVMGLTAPGALAALSVSKRFHFRSALYYAVAGMISAVPAVITCALMLPPAFALPLASRTTFEALAVVLLGALGGVLYWQLAVRPTERQPA